MNRLSILPACVFVALCSACSKEQEPVHPAANPTAVVVVKMPAAEDHDPHHDHNHGPKGKRLAGETAPHVHGAAHMNLAIEAQQLNITLTLSGMDTLGFERAAVSADEHALLSKTLRHLQNPDALFVLPKAAGCTLVKGTVETALLDKTHNKNNQPNTHAGFDSHYQWQCKQPEQLTPVSVGVFAYFPQVQKITAQWVLKNTQGAAELTPNNPLFVME